MPVFSRLQAATDDRGGTDQRVFHAFDLVGSVGSSKWTAMPRLSATGSHGIQRLRSASSRSKDPDTRPRHAVSPVAVQTLAYLRRAFPAENVKQAVFAGFSDTLGNVLGNDRPDFGPP